MSSTTVAVVYRLSSTSRSCGRILQSHLAKSNSAVHLCCADSWTTSTGTYTYRMYIYIYMYIYLIVCIYICIYLYIAICDVHLCYADSWTASTGTYASQLPPIYLTYSFQICTLYFPHSWTMRMRKYMQRYTGHVLVMCLLG